MSDVEVLHLGQFDTELNRREFDAVSYGRCFWQGLLQFERLSDTDSRIFVFSNRRDALGDDYATRPGTVEEVRDKALAEGVIEKAIVSCFDHTTNIEALPDSKGGWITLETDT